MGHNGVLTDEGWYIRTVNVAVPTTGARYTFDCQRWLARDRGDRKLVVEFSPTSVQVMWDWVTFILFFVQIIR